MSHPVSRRKFLAAASTAIAAPYFIPAKAFGANERIVTAHIGVGGQGGSNLKGMMSAGATPGALCDVDSKRLAAAMKVVADKGITAEGYEDYRKILDRKDIDAVVVSTPDHWHALPTIHACQAGKDVYVEKPLTLFIAEGRKMVEVARANKRIVQTGSQQRSDKNFLLACELVRNGKIGQLKEVLVGLPGSNYSKEPVADSAPPAELNYDLWLGPAPERPYNVNRVHYNFRFFWDYSGGQMTNWGAHHIDIAQWGLGMDNSGPISTEGKGEFHPKHWFEVTTAFRLVHTYANGVKMTVTQGDKEIPGGTTFIGSEGKIYVTRGKIESTPAEIVKTPADAITEKLYKSPGHHKNFLECVKSRNLPICDVEIGHRSATVCHLGNMAIRLGRKIQWDPAKEQIIGDEEAAKMVSRPYRSPWVLG